MKITNIILLQIINVSILVSWVIVCAVLLHAWAHSCLQLDLTCSYLDTNFPFLTLSFHPQIYQSIGSCPLLSNFYQNRDVSKLTRLRSSWLPPLWTTKPPTAIATKVSLNSNIFNALPHRVINLLGRSTKADQEPICRRNSSLRTR